MEFIEVFTEVPMIFDDTKEMIMRVIPIDAELANELRAVLEKIDNHERGLNFAPFAPRALGFKFIGGK